MGWYVYHPQDKRLLKAIKEFYPDFYAYNITNILKKHNIVYGVDLQRTPKDKVTEVIQLYQKGYSSIQISQKLEINKSTVLRILKRNNIPTRTYKETKNLGRNLPTLQ